MAFEFKLGKDSMFIQDLFMKPQSDVLNIFEPLHEIFDKLAPAEFISKINELIPQDQVMDLAALEVFPFDIDELDKLLNLVDPVKEQLNSLLDLKTEFLDVSFDDLIQYLTDSCKNICEPINNVAPALPCSNPCVKIEDFFGMVGDFKSDLGLMKQPEGLPDKDHYGFPDKDHHEYKKVSKDSKVKKTTTTTTTTTTTSKKHVKIVDKNMLIDNVKHSVAKMPMHVNQNVQGFIQDLREYNPLKEQPIMAKITELTEQSFVSKLAADLKELQIMDKIAADLKRKPMIDQLGQDLKELKIVDKIAELNLKSLLGSNDIFGWYP